MSSDVNVKFITFLNFWSSSSQFFFVFNVEDEKKSPLTLSWRNLCAINPEIPLIPLSPIECHFHYCFSDSLIMSFKNRLLFLIQSFCYFLVKPFDHGEFQISLFKLEMLFKLGYNNFGKPEMLRKG